MGKEQSSPIAAVKLAELLCARICHDLSGPVGATAAGAELFEDLGGGDPETLALVSTSAAGAAARLRLLRAALGPAAAQPLAALRALVDAHLASQVSAAAPAIVAHWRDCPEQIDAEPARLLLNLALLGRDALPRGGRMELGLTDGWPALLVHGEPASLADEVKAALLGGGEVASPRAAQAAFIRLLAAGLKGRIVVTATPLGLRVAAETDPEVEAGD